MMSGFVAWAGASMQTLLQDLRYSVRQFIKNPGFTLTALISLALGIGATTAVFSVIYAALINPYPYPNADRIVRLNVESKSGPADWVTLNGPQIRQVRQLNVVESVLAMDFHAMILTGHDVPENVNVVGLISNGFSDLGVAPVLGRGLLPSDAIDGQDPQPVVLVGYKFWQKHFLGSRDVVGKTLQLDRKDYFVVGVAAPRFTWYSADVYRPLKLSAEPGQNCVVNLRLTPGVSHEVANAALQPLLDQFAAEMPNHFPEHFKVQVEDLNAWVRRSMQGTLYLLFGAVALLLAIGCGNVSILLLARGTARQHEMAVRTAIGANRQRIIRQLLTESLVLSFTGAAIGVLFAYRALAVMVTLLPKFSFPHEAAIRINVPVLVFSVAVALMTGILFGVWPALQLSRPEVSQVMQSSTRRIVGLVQGRMTHNVLIASQAALTLLMLAGAAAAMQGFLHLIHTPLGYDPINVMSVGIPVHDGTYPTWKARLAYFEALQSKAAMVAGVTMTAISSNATPPSNGWQAGIEILGQPRREDQKVRVNFVSPGYFPLLRIPVIKGRV